MVGAEQKPSLRQRRLLGACLTAVSWYNVFFFANDMAYLEEQTASSWTTTNRKIYYYIFCMIMVRMDETTNFDPQQQLIPYLLKKKMNISIVVGGWHQHDRVLCIW